MNQLFLKEGWRRFVNPFTVAVVFTIIFGAIRGLGMLGPPLYRPLIPLGFICMMALPFIFLTKDGRRQIGFSPSNKITYYGIGILFGLTASAVCFGIGMLLFDTSSDNWFITIRNYYLNTPSMPVSTFQLFIIFTIPAMTFSPIGEEIFFRGFLQEALSSRLTVQTSMLLESLLFGVVHIFHHGFVRMANGSIQVYFWSGILWVGLMFLTAYGFAMIRNVSASIYPAMVAHTTFNLMMNVFIFSFLWET